MSHEAQDSEDVRSFDQPDSELPPLSIEGDDGVVQVPAEDVDHNITGDGSALLEQEMKRQLEDMESSFLPEAEPVAVAQTAPGADDTYLFGGPPDKTAPASRASTPHAETHDDLEHDIFPSADDSQIAQSTPTPSDEGRPPAPRPSGPDSETHVEETEHLDSEEGTSVMDHLPSSPAAAAAERSRSRSASRRNDRYPLETQLEESQAEADEAVPAEDDSRSTIDHRPTSRASTIKPSPPLSPVDAVTPRSEGPPLISLDGTIISRPLSSTALLAKRPSFNRNRQASQRSSTSSFTNRSDVSGDLEGDITLGADYALQTGGAAPSLNARPNYGLSRLPSLGSIASSVSGYSESVHSSWDRTRSVSGTSIIGGLHNDSNLERLEEEPLSIKASPPATPRALSASAPAPTDTVIAQHVRNIQVPDTVAKAFRETHSRSPDKRHTISTQFNGRGRHNLTLKEQNAKIDKLSKENFDLKLKIHFLDQALQDRSEEGVKEMIQKNVQLQTDLANEKKENQTLRRKVRDLEQKLKAQEEGLAAAQEAYAGSDDEKSTGSRYAELEDEIIYLRECLEHYEVQIEKLREENLAKEVEKRRMAEYIKSMGDRKAEPTAGVEEAMEMWKDLLEAETARREQADEDAARLREELRRLKSETASVANSTHSRNVLHINKQTHTSYVTRSHSGASDVTQDQNGGPVSSGSSTVVEQLRHENAELRRDLGAQTSMLTSRNRERERLQQEIEDLKLTVRKGGLDGGRSVAGDSIFERSVSRAHQRSASRASGGTRATQLSDSERDEYETKNAALRDEVAQTKLLNQDLERELNAHLDILQQTEADLRALKEDRDLVIADVQAIQKERDEALLTLHDKENECESLREEAISTIERLQEDLDLKEQDLSRLATELDNRNEDFIALQQEMKNVSESLIQLEDDRAASLRKIQMLEQELEDANKELEALDKRIRDTVSKNERLEVQLESTQGEVAFLREEQESDKIKIGELEAALNAAQISLQDEKERFRDLEDRLAEERRQREILDSQEKEEVQKILHDLNGQASKAKDEVRKLRKNLSSKEVEATTWKQRLDELESGLREALGDLNGTKSNLLKDVNKLQRDLDKTLQELDQTKHDLVEKDRLLRNRDALLESTGLESRRLSDLLDKERQARKQDRLQFDQAQRSYQHIERTIQQHQTRVLELETGRSQDRRKIANLEQQYRDQLLDRNNLLLALWNRLSTLCGADWATKHSLVSGELPSLEVIARNLPGFSKNIILAVTTVEGIVGSFRSRIRSIEKDLWKEYQTLEHTLDLRTKRIDHLERLVQNFAANSNPRRGGSSSRSASATRREDNVEVAKLRSENRVLKAELQFARQQQGRPNSASDSLHPPQSGSSSPTKDANRASVAASLLRHHSSSAVEILEKQPPQLYSQPLQPSEQRWIHRLKELERRLKAEREARLLDRSGARKRLEQGRLENEELRMQLEREKERRNSLLSERAESVIGGTQI